MPAKPPVKTVLIADDDQALAHLLAASLEAQGFRVELAFDAMQASMLVRRSPPAAVLLDILMPGGTGLDVLKRLKASTQAARIPVVAMSASTDPELPAKVRGLGAAEFLQKPVELEALVALLRRLLDAPGRPEKGVGG